MALPTGDKNVRIAESSRWALLKPLCLCIFVTVFSMAGDPIANAIFGQGVLYAAPSAVLGIQNGDDWIWDSGASMDLIGVQDTVNMTRRLDLL